MDENSKLIIKDHPLQLLPSLALVVGLNEALILQQFHYLIYVAKQKEQDYKHIKGRWWTYNSYEKLKKKYFKFWSVDTIKRAILNLEKQGILTVDHLSKYYIDRTKWYTINYDVFEDQMKKTQQKSKKNEPQSRQDASIRLGQDAPMDNDKVDISNGAECTYKEGQNASVNEGKMHRSRSGQDAPMLSTIDKDSNLETPNLKTPKTFAPSARGSVQDSDFGDEFGDGSGKAFTEEVSNGDIDEDGNEISPNGISSLRNPKWKQPTKSTLCKKALAATCRKHFKTKDERSSWLKIEKSTMPLDVHGKVRYPTEWVEDLIEWAESTNIEYQTANSTRVIKFSFPALLTAIHNEETRNDWVNRELHIRRTTGTCEDDPDPWGDGSESDLDEEEPVDEWVEEAEPENPW